MTDVANLGFGVDTSGLKDGVVSLQKFKTQAKAANTDVKNLGNSMTRASTTFAGAVAAMSKSVLSMVTATKGASQEQIKAAKEASDFANQIYKTAKAQDTLAVSTGKTTKTVQAEVIAIRKNVKELQKAEHVFRQLKGLSMKGGLLAGTGLTGVQSSMGSAVTGQSNVIPFVQPEETLARDVMPNRFNTANIAAQFQDIGVTAAMGMNPLTVAIQQGTQLSAILNTMESPLQGIKQAFTQIINPVSLISIAITALLVAFIQFVDWGKVLETTLNGIASAFEWMASDTGLVVTGITAITLALIALNAGLGTTIARAVTGFATMAASALAAAYKMAAAWVIGLGPIAWIVAGIATLVAGLIAFRDEIKDLIGVDVIDGIKNGVNSVIGLFVGLNDAFSNILTNMSVRLANFVTETITNMVNSVREVMSGVEGATMNGLEWMWNKTKEQFGGEEVKRGLVDSVVGGYKQAAEEIEKFEPIKFKLNVDLPDVNLKESVDKAMKVDYLGGIGDSVSNAFKGAASTVRGWADGLVKGSKEWQKLVDMFEKDKSDLELQAQLIGKTAGEVNYLTYQQKLLNEARKEGLDLTPEQTKQINEWSKALGDTKTTLDRQKNAFDESKSAAKGFFSDLKSGLIEGENLWVSFGNAALNVLNKIFDKIMDTGVDTLFSGLSGTGLFGGTPSEGDSNFVGPIKAQAKGGAWMNGVDFFAKGGTFTNSIVSSPTMFGHAGGLGVMGEKKPEAIMPLHRGSDGSLGIAATGAGESRGGNVIVNINNSSNADAQVNQRQTSQGIEIDVVIDNIIGEKLSSPGTESNRSLVAFQNRRLIGR